LNVYCVMPMTAVNPANLDVADNPAQVALDALGDIGRGLKAALAPDHSSDLLVSLGRQQPRRYRCQYHPEPISLATVERVRTTWQWRADPPHLLVAPHIAADAAQALASDDIAFVDAAGNAYLTGPGLFVRLAGRTSPKGLPKPKSPPRLFAAKGMRVMFVLLTEPDYLGRPQREIATAAQVAVGTVAGVFDGLRGLGHLREGRTAHLVRKSDLMLQWVNTYIQRKPYQSKVRFRAADPDWWRNIDIKQYDACFGGDVAAAKLTGYLKPATCIVHAFGEDTKLKRDVRMRLDPQGDILFADAFWRYPANKRADTAPPLLVYAELLATGDPRAIETAKLVYERFLIEPEVED
jgi:hypothetical protein